MTAHQQAMIAAAVPGWPVHQQEFLLEDRLTFWVFAKRYHECLQALA